MRGNGLDRRVAGQQLSECQLDAVLGSDLLCDLAKEKGVEPQFKESSLGIFHLKIFAGHVAQHGHEFGNKTGFAVDLLCRSSGHRKHLLMEGLNGSGRQHGPFIVLYFSSRGRGGRLWRVDPVQFALEWVGRERNSLMTTRAKLVPVCFKTGAPELPETICHSDFIAHRTSVVRKGLDDCHFDIARQSLVGEG